MRAGAQDSDSGLAARRSIRRLRAWRAARSLNVGLSVVLAACLLVLVNALASLRFFRWDLGARAPYRLSERTRSLLAGLQADVRITAFLRGSHPLRENIRDLLHEYEYAAAASRTLRLTVRLVDPDRDLAWTRELAREYEVSEPDTAVFECEGRRHYVDLGRLADYVYETEGARVTRRMTGFRGEQVFSSALLSVAQSRRPIVYFLRGHGEHDLDAYDRQTGYSRIATLLRRDSVEVRDLLLAESQQVPDDASALVIAGPQRRLSTGEADLIREYLRRQGRLLLLLDAGVETGLETLLAEWGLDPTPDRIVDPARTLTGREVFVTQYGAHPITHAFQNVACVLYAPRAVMPRSTDPAAGEQADRPQAVVLAWSSPQSWRETNPAQSPPVFDPDQDARGPLPLAAAVERGAIGGVAVGLAPTRLVAIGDSDFVSNGALNTSGGANADWFLSAINWLLERDALLAIAPRPPLELRLDLTRAQWRAATAVMVVGWPALVGLVGWLVAWRRRR